MSVDFVGAHFSGVASKRLSAVEAHRHRSNQHEFDGVDSLRRLLGRERRRLPARFLYLDDDLSEPVSDEGFLTWYDARESHPTRSEYRLYFPDTSVSELAREGDLLILALLKDGTLLAMIARQGSSLDGQLRWLFRLEETGERDFDVREDLTDDRVDVGLAGRLILDQIGIAGPEPDETHLETMLQRFGGGFPRTSAFSAFARLTLPDTRAKDDPDLALMTWMEREELLFRTLERHIVAERLRHGFGDVDEFISCSLSVQNRRKSRVGRALENHTGEILEAFQLLYDREAKTERNARPDFLFPGVRQYRDSSFEVQLLTVLGVKSTCKDRWRQVLAEAERIQEKHLLTLEPGISVFQTEEMRSHRLQLVLPRSIHSSFTPDQQEWLVSVGDFIQLARERQKLAGL
jgi:hypothetical protein